MSPDPHSVTRLIFSQACQSRSALCPRSVQRLTRSQVVKGCTCDSSDMKNQPYAPDSAPPTNAKYFPFFKRVQPTDDARDPNSDESSPFQPLSTRREIGLVD